MDKARALSELKDIRRKAAGDPEAAHADADSVLLAMVDPEIKAAYMDVVKACNWWAYA